MRRDFCWPVCDLPRVNGDDFNERVSPDFGQVQSSSSQPLASIFLLTQQANRVTWKQRKTSTLNIKYSYNSQSQSPRLCLICFVNFDVFLKKNKMDEEKQEINTKLQ